MITLIWEQKMKTLKDIKYSRDTKEIAEVLAATTIFDKMEFSNITKEAVKEKLHYLETVQVPNRDVLLEMDDETLVFCWLKNWIHPKLNMQHQPHQQTNEVAPVGFWLLMLKWIHYALWKMDNITTVIRSKMLEIGSIHNHNNPLG